MKVQPINGLMAWQIVSCYINRTGSFNGISGQSYPCRCTEDTIYYVGENRNNGEEEDIQKKDFISAFDSILSLENMNTNTIKGLIPNKIYQKRTPFIGLLISASIIK